jgi:hypothetical protein
VNGTVEVGRLHFRFECQPGCTNCCTQNGHVYLTEADITTIAGHLGLTPAEFEKRYVTRRDEHLRLKMRSNERCYFLEDGACRIHPVKPLQCRVFPFWPENVTSKAAWHRLRRFCPGVGVGPLVQIQAVRQEAEAYREAFPEL